MFRIKMVFSLEFDEETAFSVFFCRVVTIIIYSYIMKYTQVPTVKWRNLWTHYKLYSLNLIVWKTTSLTD